VKSEIDSVEFVRKSPSIEGLSSMALFTDFRII
jgi:hypothetical protein